MCSASALAVRPVRHWNWVQLVRVVDDCLLPCAFLTKTLPKVAAEMALSVLAYNLTRVMNIVGIKPLIAAFAA